MSEGELYETDWSRWRDAQPLVSCHCSPGDLCHDYIAAGCAKNKTIIESFCPRDGKMYPETTDRNRPVGHRGYCSECMTRHMNCIEERNTNDNAEIAARKYGLACWVDPILKATGFIGLDRFAAQIHAACGGALSVEEIRRSCAYSKNSGEKYFFQHAKLCRVWKCSPGEAKKRMDAADRELKELARHRLAEGKG